MLLHPATDSLLPFTLGTCSSPRWMPCREACGRCECVVLFSDDAQRFTALKSLNEEQQALAARRQAILDRLEHAREAAGNAAAVHKSACKAVEKRQKGVSYGFGRYDKIQTAFQSLSSLLCQPIP